MRNYILIVLLPPIVAYSIAFFLVDFEFLYYLVFGFMVVGIDLFTMGTYEKIEHNKINIVGTYLLLLFSIVLIIFRILSFYADDGQLLQMTLLAIIVAVPVSIYVYWQFFINHIAGRVISNQKKETERNIVYVLGLRELHLVEALFESISVFLMFYAYVSTKFATFILGKATAFGSLIFNRTLGGIYNKGIRF